MKLLLVIEGRQTDTSHEATQTQPIETESYDEAVQVANSLAKLNPGQQVKLCLTSPSNFIIYEADVIQQSSQQSNRTQGAGGSSNR